MKNLPKGKSDLLETISMGENETLEFKLDKVRNEHLSKELGALANFQVVLNV